MTQPISHAHPTITIHEPESDRSVSVVAFPWNADIMISIREGDATAAVNLPIREVAMLINALHEGMVLATTDALAQLERAKEVAP